MSDPEWEGDMRHAPPPRWVRQRKLQNRERIMPKPVTHSNVSSTTNEGAAAIDENLSVRHARTFAGIHPRSQYAARSCAACEGVHSMRETVEWPREVMRAQGRHGPRDHHKAHSIPGESEWGREDDLLQANKMLRAHSAPLRRAQAGTVDDPDASSAGIPDLSVDSSRTQLLMRSGWAAVVEVRFARTRKRCGTQV